MQTDATETGLGITVYLGSHHHGFDAISKALYSDFVVHEIHSDDSVARLTHYVLDGPEQKEADDRKRKRPHKQEEQQPQPQTKEAPDWKALEGQLTEMVEAEAAASTIAFLVAKEAETAAASTATTTTTTTSSNSSGTSPPPISDHSKNQKFVCLPKLNDKETRRQLHYWIRSALGFCAAADTQEGGIIRVWHKSCRGDMPNQLDHGRGNHHRRDNNNSNNKKYLQFVLYKENIDTGAAIQSILRRLGGSSSRGRQQGRNRHHNIRIGYAGNKDKRGITSQFVTIGARQASIATLQSKINSVGTSNSGRDFMRVGNFVYVDTELRLGKLKGNRFNVVLRNAVPEQSSGSLDDGKQVLRQAVQSIQTTGFINYFGTQRFGKHINTHLVGMAVLRKDFEGAINTIMAPKSGERDTVRDALVEFQDRFANDPPDKAAAEQECAKKVIPSMNRFMQSELSILNSLIRKPLDYQAAFSSITKTMRMMFIHAVQSFLFNHAASHRIQALGSSVLAGDLVLADNGVDEKKGVPSVHVVTKDEAASGKYGITDVVLPLIGSQTQNPENESAKLMDDLLVAHNLTRDMFVSNRAYHCDGDYRKLVVLPGDIEYNIVEYKDERQALLQTDIMKLEGVPLDIVTGTPEENMLALVVGFSLPSSAYATIFLRELMKRPTSFEYQKDLSLSKKSREPTVAAINGGTTDLVDDERKEQTT